MLAEIFRSKLPEIAERKQQISETELLGSAEYHPRGFLRALRAASSDGQTGLIAEVKKASPSSGVIRDPFDVNEVVRAYENAGATALSVLTDSHYFQGSPRNLQIARERNRLPILRKDFICDRYQLAEAVNWGADAVLLIVAGLERSQLTELYLGARELKLDVLVEVHSEAEMEVAAVLEAGLIGINNRDLKTFKTDLRMTQRLAANAPAEALLVSESAIRSHEDVEFVQSYGAKAVLIGSAFCSQPDIEASVRSIMGWPVMA